MAKTQSKMDKTLMKVTTEKFRVSYPHVFKAQSLKPTDKPKYSITMLFPKSTDMSSIKEAIKNAKIAAWGDKKNWPKDLESPVADGDDERFIDEETGKHKEGYKGHWVIKASSNENSKPGVVDEDAEPIMDQSLFYAGCFARAHIFATNWEYMKKQGIMFILDHVQKLDEGKPLGSKKSAKDVFAPVGTGKKSSSKKANFDEDEDEDFGDDEESEESEF